MPQPVKLSDALIDAAREAATDADRSLAGQIEHWARLGRSVESVLTADEAGGVKRSARAPSPSLHAELLQTLRLAVRSEGHPHLGKALVRSGRPVYGTDPAFPGLLVRIGADGLRTPGRFRNRRFIPLEADDVPARRR